MTINKDEFISFLEEYLLEEEAKELNIKITGELEEDYPLIDSPQKANYFLNLALKAKEEIDTINELCDKEIEKIIKRINEYREKQIKPVEKQYEYYEKLLRNYTMKELDLSNKRSVKLPYGTLSLRKQQPKWDYGNEKELIEYLKQYEDSNLLNKKEVITIDKKLLKEIAINNGDNVSIQLGEDNIVLPGIQVIEQEDKFSIK